MHVNIVGVKYTFSAWNWYRSMVDGVMYTVDSEPLIKTPLIFLRIMHARHALSLVSCSHKIIDHIRCVQTSRSL